MNSKQDFVTTTHGNSFQTYNTHSNLDGFFVAGKIIDKLQRRVDYKILEHDIDHMRNDFCINLSFSSALKTVQYNFEIPYDEGHFRFDTEEESIVEPQAPKNDVYATQCLPTNNQRVEALPNLYDENQPNNRKVFLERKAMLHDLQQVRKKHLILKHGSANVVGSVGEPWASEGVVKIKDPRQIEADDELAMKVRHEKDMQKLRLERNEKEAKEKVLRDKQRALEIDGINKELDRGHYTYDFEGNVLLQNAQIAEQLPPDFKFKYKFKKGKQKIVKENVESFGFGQKKKSVVDFKDSKQTGFQPADANKLVRLVEPKGVDSQFKFTAGSMFEYFKPEEAGVLIKEQNRVKASKKDFEDVAGKMSLLFYNQKVNADGNFQSAIIHPEVLQAQVQPEHLKQLQEPNIVLLSRKSALLGTIAQGIKNEIDDRLSDHREQLEFINRLREEHGTLGTAQLTGNNMLTDKHLVVLKSPESLNTLILRPEQERGMSKRKTSSIFSGIQPNMSAIQTNINRSNAQTANVSNGSAIQNGGRRGLFKNQSASQISAKEPNMKTLEVTNDLYRLQRDFSQEKQLGSLKQNTLEYKALQDDLNTQILYSSNWGFNQQQSLPQLAQHTSSKSSKFHTYASQSASLMFKGWQPPQAKRPQTNQSNYYSLRATLSTANSGQSFLSKQQIQSRQSKRVRVPQSDTSTKATEHLAQPPIGKTLGHGLIKQTNQRIIIGNGQSQEGSVVKQEQKKTQQKLNTNHLFNKIGLKSLKA